MVRGSFDAVVIATVESAGYTGERGRDWHPWKGSARVKKVVAGNPDAPSYPIGRTGSAAACDDGIKPPAAGDEWVLYLSKLAGQDRQEVISSYPLELVRRADPRLADYK